MSQPTLTEVQAFIQAHIPDFPLAKYGVHVNLVLEEIYERLNQIGYSTFTTKAPTTSGTVNVSNGTTSAVFSGSVLATTDGLRLVQIGDDATWYELTRTNGTTGVLSSVYAGTTNTLATYTIVYPTISFGATVGKILSIQMPGFQPLDFVSSENPAETRWDAATGIPLEFSQYMIDTAATPDDAERIFLRPFPNDAYSFQFSFYQRPTLIDPSGALSQTVDVPTGFRQPLLYATLALCWLAEDQEQADRWERKAGEAFRKALANTGKPAANGRRLGVYGVVRRQGAYQQGPY